MTQIKQINKKFQKSKALNMNLIIKLNHLLIKSKLPVVNYGNNIEFVEKMIMVLVTKTR